MSCMLPPLLSYSLFCLTLQLVGQLVAPVCQGSMHLSLARLWLGYTSISASLLFLVFCSFGRLQYSVCQGVRQPVGGIVIHWVTLGISHIPIYLFITTYNIAKCYTTHQMPPTFAQIKGTYF